MIGSTKKGDYISWISFSSKIFIEISLTDSLDHYFKNFPFTKLEKYGGGTAIYDAVSSAVQELHKAPDGYNKILILFTDGGDNSSKLKLDSAMLLAKQNDVQVYSIAYSIGFNFFEPIIKLAEYTGGKFYNISSEKEFPYVFAEIYLSIYNYYKITYKAPDRKNYHSVSANLYFPNLNQNITTYCNYDKSIFTNYDPVGTVVFKNIEFDFGKATIKQESLPVLNEIAQALKDNDKIEIIIRGHTDDVGTTEYNLKLSEKRAIAVKDELIKNGISYKRLKAVGYGKSLPLVANDSEENRKKNRRTEFVISDK
jgi:outer membrane protein OmpA-like peptidoglycan-associated protein